MKRRKKENKSTINADKKLAKIKIKKLVKKRFEKKKENFRYIIFEDLVVENSNARVLAKYHINDTTLSSNIIENFSFEFKNVLKKESDV